MATGKTSDWLKERISCSACFKIFDKPHSLSCLHTLCKGCVHDLKITIEGGTDGYECPVCREFCPKGNVRQNFLITELLALYKMLTVKGEASPCKQCTTADAIHRCVECKSDYCVECKTVHDGFPLMSTHHMVDLVHIEQGIVVDKLIFCPKHADKLVELNCKNCETPICDTCNATKHKSHECETTEEALDRIVPEIKEHQSHILDDIYLVEERNRNLKEPIDDIYSSIESMKQTAKDAHTRLRKKLDKDLDSLIAQLDQMRDRVTRQEKECSDKCLQHVQHSKDVVNWVETTLTTAKGTCLLHELQSGVREKLQKMSQRVHTNRELLPREDCIEDATITTGLELIDYTDNNIIGQLKRLQMEETSSGYWPIQLTTFFHRQPTKMLSVRLPKNYHSRYGNHFTIIEGELWIAGVKDGKECVILNSTNGKYTRTINLPTEINTPRAIVSTKYIRNKTRHIIIAGENGLFVLSMDGILIQTLAKGDFSDVCLSGKSIFALEYEQQRVYSFQFRFGEWKIKTIVHINYLKETGTSGYDIYNTIQVYNNHLYIYTMGVDRLQKYTMDGTLVSQCGEEKKSGNAGQFYAGKLCGYDNAGTLIFCDENNARLQLLTADAQWQVITLDGIEPRYAIPMGNNSFWVLDDYELHLYKSI